MFRRRLPSSRLLIALFVLSSSAGAASIYVSTQDAKLYTVMTSGATTLIGSTGVPLCDLGVFNGAVYGTDCASSFYSVNPSNGVLSRIGSTGVSDVNALAFSPSGTLYGAVGNQLFTINTASGAASVVGSGSYNAFGDLAFSSSGALYLTSAAGTGSPASLYSVNASNGMGSVIGPIGFSDVYGLVFVDGVLYGFDIGGDILNINTTTGAGTRIANDGLPFYGAAYESSPVTTPEPTTISLFGVFFGLMVLRLLFRRFRLAYCSRNRLLDWNTGAVSLQNGSE
jgi:hypothetical protein